MGAQESKGLLGVHEGMSEEDNDWRSPCLFLLRGAHFAEKETERERERERDPSVLHIAVPQLAVTVIVAGIRARDRAHDLQGFRVLYLPPVEKNT